MKITIDETEARFLVTLDGEMDTAAAAEAEELLRPLYKTNGNSKVLLRHVSDEIKDVFRLTGFISLFDFE